MKGFGKCYFIFFKKYRELNSDEGKITEEGFLWIIFKKFGGRNITSNGS